MQNYASILTWVFVIVVFYFFLIMPERKKQKKMRNMMNSLNVGDEIMTKGGIFGKITNIDEDNLIIESEGTRLKITKIAVASVNSSVEEEKEYSEK